MIFIGRFGSLTLLSTIAGGLYSLGYFIVCLPSGIRLVAQTALAPNPKARLRSALQVLFPEEFLAQHVPHPTDPSAQVSNFKLFRDILVARSKREIERGIPIDVPSTTFFKQVLAVATHRVTDNEMKAINKKLNGRVLVVTGDQDILVHMANSKRLANGLSAKYIELNGAGHGASEQYADLVNSEIERLILGGPAKL